MKTPAHTQTLPQFNPAASLLRWMGIYGELMQVRLVWLVGVTAIVGYLLGANGRIDWITLLATAIGTGLTGGAANGLNQWIEVERDARMKRTAGRPIPSGRISRTHAFIFLMLMAVLGVWILWAMTNSLAAGLAIASMLIYLLIYTPLKVISTMNTLVGAVSGAIPPMLGWAAATGGLESGAWVLFATQFIWQMPHFFALAWLYRKDYQAGGFRMLPCLDASGAITCRTIVLFCFVLMVVGLSAVMVGLAGWWYAIGSLALGAWLLKSGLIMYLDRTDASARRMFMSSIIYLPLLLGLMVIDAGPVLGQIRGGSMPIQSLDPWLTQDLSTVPAHPVGTGLQPAAQPMRPQPTPGGVTQPDGIKP